MFCGVITLTKVVGQVLIFTPPCFLGCRQDERNKLLSQNEVCLANIDQIYQVNGERRKKLLPGTSIITNVKTIQLVCKVMSFLHVTRVPIILNLLIFFYRILVYIVTVSNSVRWGSTKRSSMPFYITVFLKGSNSFSASSARNHLPISFHF